MSEKPILTVADQNRESLILIVDDDSTLLKFFKIHLNRLFSKVIVVPNAREAMTVLKDKAIDLVLTDLRMPGVDGIEFLAKVKRFSSAIPVVLVTGAMLDAEQEAYCKEHADGFLRKPFDVDDLHSIIELNLQKRRDLLALQLLCKNPKSFKDLLTGKASLDKTVKKQDIQQATEIYASLQKSA